MPEKPLPIGEYGRNVAANVERLRRARRISLRGLSSRLAEYGRPIVPSVLDRQVQGVRRTDADDLVVFAAVLGVTPDVLLAPPGDRPPEHAAAAAARQLAGRIETLLEAAGDPAAREFASGSVDRALRRVQIEVEELLDEAPLQALKR